MLGRWEPTRWECADEARSLRLVVEEFFPAGAAGLARYRFAVRGRRSRVLRASPGNGFATPADAMEAAELAASQVRVDDL
jgi:hypothetical protein